MPSSIEKIVDGFPFPTIDPIIGTPDYKSIADIHLKLNLNAVSVQSNLGCGTLSLLFLTVLTAVYATLSTTKFVPPVNPGTNVVVDKVAYTTGEAVKYKRPSVPHPRLDCTDTAFKFNFKWMSAMLS